MVVIQADNEQFYIDGYLKQNLDDLKNIVTEDWDMIIVVDGYEGSGKSVFAMQCAKYCDHTLNLDRVVFNPDDFKKAVKDAKQYQAIVYDEAYGGLASKSALSKVNKTLVQMLTVIRQRNLFVFIVLPTFFDLDKYVALWRSRALMHVYTDANMKRGYFEFYNAARKKQMYVMGKKFYEYRQGKCNFRGRFTNKWVVDKAEYDHKKLTRSLDAEQKEALNVYRLRDKLICDLVNSGMTQAEVGRRLGFEQQRISQIVLENAYNKQQTTSN